MSEPYEMVQWEDIKDAASKMFKVWVLGGELEWARECWAHFAESGLTENATVIEYTATQLRLVTLARIYEEFCGLAWEENPDTPIAYLAEDLDIDPVALGVLAARTAKDLDDAGDETELRNSALLAITDAQRSEIHQCLCTAYGTDIALYSRMSRTKHSRDSEEDDDGEEFDVTGPNSCALQFIMEGFPS
jgi:hypothetical protein